MTSASGTVQNPASNDCAAADRESSEVDPLLDNAVRTLHSRFSEAPTNWHQATVFVLSSEDPRLREAGPRMLAGGYLMVACQLLTTAALWSSTSFPSCETSDQCPRGRWCSIGVQAGGARCQPCGDDLPLPKQTDSARGYTYNMPAPSEPEFAGYNLTLVRQTCAEPTKPTVGIFGVGVVTLFPPEAVTEWCAACTNAATRFVDPVTHVMELEANAAVMGWIDWVALVLASYIVGITVAGEIKDIRICSLATTKAVDVIGVRYQHALAGSQR